MVVFFVFCMVPEVNWELDEMEIKTRLGNSTPPQCGKGKLLCFLALVMDGRLVGAALVQCLNRCS